MKILLLVSLLAITANTARAGDSAESRFDFPTLAQEREDLILEIQTLRDAVPMLKARRDSFTSMHEDEKQLKTATERLKLLQAKTNPSDAAVTEMKQLDEFITSATAEIAGNLPTPEEIAKVNDDIQKADVDIKEKKAKLSNVERTLSDGLNQEIARQEFKTKVSFYFAVLVSVVIAGFFVVVALDQVVRRAIFKGQAGIQFLTLFSLVIAIILFGITGILEGKELSALLAGISGFILGKASDALTSPQEREPPAGGAGGAQGEHGAKPSGAVHPVTPA